MAIMGVSEATWTGGRWLWLQTLVTRQGNAVPIAMGSGHGDHEHNNGTPQMGEHPRRS
jgi:hypothetical protein